MFKAVQVHHIQHFADFCPDLLFALPVDAHPERHVVVNIQVRKQGIFLKNGIDFPPIRGKAVDFPAIKKDIARIRFYKSSDNPQGRSLTAPGRTQQSNKFAVLQVKIKIFQNCFPVK